MSSVPNSATLNLSLKRSISRNRFFNSKKQRQLVTMRDELKAPVATADDDDEDGRLEEAAESKVVANRLGPVRNFFNRVVNQVSLSRTLRSKHEWKRRFDLDQRVPGVIGIRNHGNTCFINAILQCLSYTDILAEYLVLDQYKSDLKRKRTLKALSALNKRGCSKGEVTEQLAIVFKSLWSLQYDPEISIRFKSLVEKNASQYKGGRQHDAQEFLLWLLDQVHEDLNVATRRRQRKLKITLNDGSDEALAADALANYLRANNSFVVDVFQAQFRSSLTCPECEKQSNTFDPFLCVSLPIPRKQLVPVYVTVLYIDQSPRQVKLGLTVGANETIGDLRRTLSKDTGVPEVQILLTEIDGTCFRRTFSDEQSVACLKDSDESLYCIEMPHHQEASEDEGAFVVLAWINVLKEGPIERRFGSPYVIQVSRETLYADLQKLLMKEMASILHDDILISAQKVPLFKIRVFDGFDEATYLDSAVDLPMYTEAVEQAVNFSSYRPVHVKLVLEWDAPAKSQIIADDKDLVEEHSSVKLVQKSPEEATSVSLQECFSLYTRAETLSQGDAWFCSACDRKQEVVKKMGLWSLPDVLVIHLKRFRQSTCGDGCNKLTTLVEFPLENFDMSPNVADRSSGPSAVNGGTVSDAVYGGSKMKVLSALTPWKHPMRNKPSSRPSSGQQPPMTTTTTTTVDNVVYTYDLYAVCNHHGNDLQGGHYTATCRNPTDGHWYLFDDVQTRKVEEHDVISDEAYILFYQKTTSTSSTISTSSNSSSEHWVYRMPDFTFKGKKAGSVAKSSEKSSPGSSDDNFVRNNGKYATLPTKKLSDRLEFPGAGHFSDGEEFSSSSDSETDEEARKPPLVVDEDLRRQRKVEDETSDRAEDVSRPIDKNDVD